MSKPGQDRRSPRSAAARLSALDPRAQAVVAGLHARGRAQFGALIGHYLPKLPAMLLGKPIDWTRNLDFYRDKLLAIEPGQGELLYFLARSARARCVVEFGTSFGVSTIYLAAALRDAGDGGRVIGPRSSPRKRPRRARTSPRPAWRTRSSCARATPGRRCSIFPVRSTCFSSTVGPSSQRTFSTSWSRA